MNERTGEPRDSSLKGQALDRRQVLGLIGVGGLAWASSSAVAQPPPGCETAPCPASAPAVQEPPNLDHFPPIARLVSVLARMGKTAQDNREGFNTCPDDFLTKFYKLSDSEVRVLLAFDPYSILGYIGEKIPTPISNPDMWKAQYQLGANTLTFWEWWKSNEDDCYEDPLKCAVPKQYGTPNTQIYKAQAVPKGGNDYTIQVDGQGFVRPDSIQLTLFPDNKPLVTTRDGNSTFRCGRLTAPATLTKGNKYRVLLSICGYEVPSDEFEAT